MIQVTLDTEVELCINRLRVLRSARYMGLDNHLGSPFLKLIMWSVRCLIAWCLLISACTTTQRAAPPVKLTLFGLTLDTGRQLKQDVIDEFTAETGIPVDMDPTLGNSAEQSSMMSALLKRS